MSKTVVILGAGFAGVPLAHYLMSRVAPSDPELRVVLVSPNDHFYWVVASPRFVIPGQLDESKYMFPIDKSFSKYPASQFEFVAGSAARLVPESNSVVVALNSGSGSGSGDGAERTIPYHTLVVATGSNSLEGMPWKGTGTTAQTRASVRQLQEAIAAADSIVVAGAGATGVEFTGELGSEYGKTGKKSITIISADTLPLGSNILTSVREAARNELTKLKVEVVGGATVTSVSVGDGGKKVIELTKKDGSKTTLKADLFVPTYGAAINTQFAPEDMWGLDGRLEQNTSLRSPKYKNIFIVGDAGNLQSRQLSYADAQVRHLAKHFSKYLKTGEIEPYQPDEKTVLAVTVGRDRGTGQSGSMKIFSLLIWWFKGRSLGTQYAPDVAAGLRSITAKWE
ncbi:hypothetical protein BX600DRAFT_501662 [Xylariales sp. PMI_506]|nr:hypothetical protein BX600DRAFT_501662 [Xylariales sp. PMI_506]